MNSHWSIRILRSRYSLAAIAGLLWTGAFPNLGFAGLAWIAPGLLVAAALGKGRGESFRIGYVGGLVHFLSMLYWLLLIPYRWHGLPLAPATGWLALGAYLALFPAAWVLVVRSARGGEGDVSSSSSSSRTAASSLHEPEKAIPPHPNPSPQRRGEEAVRVRQVQGFKARNFSGNSLPGERGRGEGEPSSSSSSSHTAAPTGVLSRSWLRRTAWALGGAAVWVAWEMAVARMLGGFPWDLLGVSQYQMIPLIQVASVTGVYGVSFLIVWISLSMLSAGLAIIRAPAHRSSWLGEVFLPLLVIAVIFNFGLRQMRHPSAPARTLHVTLIQPSIPQAVIWNSTENNRRFEDLVRYSDQVLTNQTDLLIWPESAVPEMVAYDTNTFEAVSGLAQRHKVWMIIGSDDAERRDGPKGPVDYFNSSFLVSPEGKLRQRYIKRNLVIFGEYLPLQDWMPFLKYFTPITGGFTPGTRAVQFELSGLDVKTSTLICFEDVFPHLGRTEVEPDTDFLVNLTNDGWFGEAAEQWQHAASALFRAVENGVPLVRCTNNGLTCRVDDHGRIVEFLRDGRGSIYSPGFLRLEIPLPARGARHELTFYTRHGDWFGWGCVGVAAGIVVARLIARRRTSAS